nr:hypothetical protein CFP56_27048 [Quercus suber]
METQAETNQANLVTNEGVIPVININELPVANEPAINAMLLPNEDIDSIPPMAVTIDTDLARHDKDQNIKGNSVRAINGRSNSDVSNFVPLVKNRGTRKSAGNQEKKFFAVKAAPIHIQSLTNPNPKCSKKSTTWTKQARRPTQGKWSRLRQAQVSSPSLREEDKGLGKRVMDDNRILPELPNKRRQVS